MDADSLEDTPLQPPQIHLPTSSSSPGYSISVPIRAPLTIDSDSEIYSPTNDHIYSRTSSFNSTSSSSIDITISSTYTDEHTTNLDQEIVFQRPFVRYPDASYLKDSYNVSSSVNFRPFVRMPGEESGGDGFGNKLSVPIAPLSREHDSDGYSDSDSDCFNGVVKKGVMVPKVRSFDDDDELQAVENLSCVSTESVGNEGCEVECWNEVDLEKIDVLAVSSLINEIENLNSDSTGLIGNKGGEEVEYLNKAVKLSMSGASSFDMERNDEQIVLKSVTEVEIERGAQIVSKSVTEAEHSKPFLTELVENKECEVECFDLERVDAQTVLNPNNVIETETVPEPDEPNFDSDIIDTQVVFSNSDSQIENLNSVSTELTSKIEIKTVDENKQEAATEKEEDMVTRMQRVRTKFLWLALNEQLTTNVNREGGNYKFDFHLTILVIGKTGVGKSATINSIFGETKAVSSAFDPGTTKIQELTGNVDGIQLRVIDTPGLKCSSSDRSYNSKILKSVRRFTRKHTPDVVLYVDRLDTRDVNDSDLLTSITSSLGSSVWRSCIIGLTHASCDPLFEPSRRFVIQRRCCIIQEQILRFGGGGRLMPNPVWLVDNHPSYEHDIVDLDFGLKGLTCLDKANEVDGCDQVPTFKPSSEPSSEQRNAYFTENGYYVKLLGTKHWSFGCRVCF